MWHAVNRIPSATVRSIPLLYYKYTFEMLLGSQSILPTCEHRTQQHRTHKFIKVFELVANDEALLAILLRGYLHMAEHCSENKCVCDWESTCISKFMWWITVRLLSASVTSCWPFSLDRIGWNETTKGNWIQVPLPQAE